MHPTSALAAESADVKQGEETDILMVTSWSLIRASMPRSLNRPQVSLAACK